MIIIPGTYALCSYISYNTIVYTFVWTGRIFGAANEDNRGLLVYLTVRL